MSIQLTDHEFLLIYRYFEASFSAVDNSGIHATLDLEEEAWVVVQEVAKSNRIDRSA